MRTVLFGLLALMAINISVLADDSPEAEFHRIITQQLGALKNGDADGAWAFAHPTIQQQFGTAQRFYRMVDQSYRPLIDFVRAQFREAKADGDAWIQTVWLRDLNNDEYLVYYAIAKDAAGRWRIAGCQIFDYEQPGI